MQSTGAIQVKNSAYYGGDGERLLVVVSEGKKKIEIQNQNSEGKREVQGSPDLVITTTETVLEPGSTLHGSENLRVTLVTDHDPTAITGTQPGEVQNTCTDSVVPVHLNPLHAAPAEQSSTDDSPMADDDQHNEEQFVAHVIMHWMKCQNLSAVAMTHRQQFHPKGLRPIALKIAEALDQQHERYGIESMDNSDTWNKLAINLLALYHVGDSTWMLGMDLWGPGKGMIREKMLQSVRKMRQDRMFEFDGLTIEIPHHRSRKREGFEDTAEEQRHSPRTHHRSHSYRIFGRGPRIPGQADEPTNPEIDIAEAQTAHQSQQPDGTAAESATEITGNPILEEGTPQQQSNDGLPGQAALQRPNTGSKRKKSNRLSVTQAKKAKAQTEVKPANTGTSDDPIDLDTFDPNGFPIQNVQATDLRNNRARAMWRLQSRMRNRNDRHVDAVKWCGNPADLPADLAIVASAEINGKQQDVVFDTAAMVTCISKEVWAQIGSPTITPVQGNVCGADGTQLKLVGAVRLMIEMSGNSFPYRAWVIDGLQSEVLLGLDFISFHKFDLMFSSLTARCGDTSIPMRLEGWGRKKQRNMNAKIKVVAAHTLTIPPEHERELPAVVATKIPKEWAGRTMIFVPSNVWRGYEIASFITLADNSEFKVLTKNLTRDKDACIEAGMILGHFEVLNADFAVKALRTGHPPADALNLVNHDATGNDLNIDATHAQTNQPDDQKDQTSELNQISELNESNQMANGTEQHSRKIDTRNETPKIELPQQGGQRCTAAATSFGQDPAQTHMVTQDRRVHAPDEVGDNPYQGVALRGGHPIDVAWHVMGVQPGVSNSRSARGTLSRSNGNFKDQKHEEPQVANEEPQVATISKQGDVVPIAVNHTDVLTDLEGREFHQPGAQADSVNVNAVTPINQPDSANPTKALNDQAQTCKDNKDKFSAPKTGDDQHEWDEQTFRQRVEAALVAQKVAIDDHQRAQLIELLCKHKDLWIAKELGKINYEYDIEIPSYVNPTKASDRRWSKKDTDQIKEEIESLLKKGFIEPARSPWASRLVLVTKPDGSTRVCVDYRGVNSVTITDAYPTPRIEHVLERLNGNIFFSTFDCEKGYYQVGMTERTKNVSAFVCPFGQYRWTKMPFGFKNAPAVFQRLMDLILSGLSWECCMVFFDDIVVYSKTWDDHVRDLDTVFSTIGKAGMTLNFRKSVFAQQQLVYLGYLVSQDGLKPNPRKVDAVQAIQVPKTVSDLRTFLGMTSYFRRFILNYARVAKPLNELIRKGSGRRNDTTSIVANWGKEQQDAFEKLKSALISDNMLIFPDLSKEFTLECDASDGALGAVLLQKDAEGKHRPVEYASRLLSPREQRWSVTEREGLASVWGIQQFRHYLHGQRFKLVTDHSAITYMMKQVDPKGRLARWVVTLQEFDFEVIHKPGKENSVADGLSRLGPTDNTHVADYDDGIPVPGDDDDYGPASTFSEPKPQDNLVIEAPAEDDAIAVRKVMFDKRKQRQSPVPLNPDETTKALVTNPAEIPSKTWTAAQWADPMWRVMRDWLTNKQLSKDQPDLNEWAVRADSEYEIHDDILCRRVKVDLAGHDVFRLVPVVPKLLQMKVVLRAHSRDCAHQGVNKTFDWIRRRFWWPGYFRDVRQVVKECTTCQATAQPKSSTIIEGRIKAEREYDVVAIDLLKLPRSKQGYKYLLVAVDHFTRFAWVVPIKSKSAKATMEAFLKLDIPVNKPRILLSDNGTEFCNETFDQYTKAFGIKQHFTVPYHPQSDGVVERFNRTLVSMLRAYADESGENWPFLLKKTLAAYNGMKHPTIGMAPYTALHKLERDADLFTVQGVSDVCGHNEYTQLREWLSDFYTKTNEWTDHSNNESRQDRSNFNVGDLVWCRDYTVERRSQVAIEKKTPGSTGPGKLAMKWSGPWLVTATWGNVVMTLKRVGGGQTRRAHTDQVKPFHISATTPNELKRGREPRKPTAAEQSRVVKLLEREKRAADMDEAINGSGDDMDDGSNSEGDIDATAYDVEEICGHFHTDRGFWFLVKFEGYSDPTWEFEGLINSPGKVTQYFKRVCEDNS